MRNNNQKTFEDFSLLRVNDFRAVLKKIDSEIENIKPDATITEIRRLSRELEKDLGKLSVNVSAIKEHYGLLELLREVQKKRPNDAIINSAVEDLERSYAEKLVEIAKNQLSKYV
jgi:hypothetical protein